MSVWDKKNERLALTLNSTADLTLIYIKGLILYHGYFFLKRSILLRFV